MTVSTDWLEKLAQALGVGVVDLLQDNQRKGIPLLGALGRGGRLAPGQENDHFTLDVPADDPVAIKISDKCGPYPAGTILIGNRYHGYNLSNAAGRDAIVALKDGSILLRRVIANREGKAFSLVSLESGGEVMHGADPAWAAPVIMTIFYG